MKFQVSSFNEIRQVYTSHLKGAGTDANVTICLYGSNGLNSGMQKLDTHKNNFVSGSGPCTSV